MNAGDWRSEAACSTDPNPEHWFSLNLAEVTRAVAVCRSCPVIFVCDQTADDEQEEHGIWAGVIRDAHVSRSVARQEQEAAQAAQEAATRAAERQERRRAMHAAQREQLRADPERYQRYLDAARARMQRRREQQALEREQRRQSWSTTPAEDVVTGA